MNCKNIVSLTLTFTILVFFQLTHLENACNAWTADVIVTSSEPSLSPKNLTFGYNPNATNGYDIGLDVLTDVVPPPLGGPYLNTYFKSGDRPKALAVDIRPVDPWSLKIGTNRDFTLSWDISLIPSIVSPIMDIGENSIDMREKNSTVLTANSYSIYIRSADGTLPVELSLFKALLVNEGIKIKWRTETETDNLGFNIYRSDTKDGKYIKVNATLIKGVGTDATPHDYFFTDEDVVLGESYYYYIEDVDFTGKTNKSHIIKITVGKQSVKTHLIPRQFVLLQNYPNPFNPETWIPYQLASDASVTIKIYNAKGQFIRTLHLGSQTAGVYVSKSQAAYWDGKNAIGQAVGSGVYFYHLKAGDFSAVRRMVIVK